MKLFPSKQKKIEPVGSVDESNNPFAEEESKSARKRLWRGSKQKKMEEATPKTVTKLIFEEGKNDVESVYCANQEDDASGSSSCIQQEQDALPFEMISISNILAETLSQPPLTHEDREPAQAAENKDSSGSISSLSDADGYDKGVIDLTDYDNDGLYTKTKHEYVGFVEDADEAYTELVQNSGNPVTKVTYKLFGANRALYW